MQIANTCTFPKLKISVEICIGRGEGRFIEFRKESTRKEIVKFTYLRSELAVRVDDYQQKASIPTSFEFMPEFENTALLAEK